MPEITGGWTTWADRHPVVDVIRDQHGFACDLQFLPSGPDVPTAMQRFRSEVMSALIVISELLDKDRSAQPILPSAAGQIAQTSETKPLTHYARTRAVRRDITISALGAIARIGWELGRTPEASSALDHLRDEFARRETASLWLNQVMKLAAAAVLVSGACIAVFEGLPRLTDDPLGPFRNMLLVIAGTPIGVWLSHALRRPRSDFMHLSAMLTESRGLLINLIAFLILSAVVALVFVSNLVTISIGQFTTGISAEKTAASAILIGLMIGLLRPMLSNWMPDVVGAMEASSDRRRTERGLMEIPRAVEDLLSDLPQRTTELLTKGEAGLALTQSMTDSVSRVMETRLAEIPRQAAAAVTEGVAGEGLRRSVNETVRSAFTPPTPVNWVGIALVEIGPTDEASTVETHNGQAVVTLSPGVAFEIRVTFVADPELTGVGVPVRIRDGVAAPEVPFELRVDAGLTNLAPWHRDVMAPAVGRGDVIRFPFAFDKPGDILANYPISVSVYQHRSRYGTLLIATDAAESA